MELEPVSFFDMMDSTMRTNMGGSEAFSRQGSHSMNSTSGPRKARTMKHGMRNPGLGYGIGGELARRSLAGVGAGIAQPPEPSPRGIRIAAPNEPQEALPVTPRLLPVRETTSLTPGRDAAGESVGCVMSLLLNDNSPPDQNLLKDIGVHRWTFKGAVTLAEKSRAYCFFVWALLELQRNVQTDEEGDVLDDRIVRACRAFVATQTRQGQAGEMYQVLAHFICNSLVFHEWDRFVRSAFEHPRANQEAFLAPHLEQVWVRFQKLSSVLDRIFGLLDERFVWIHRLPRVRDLLVEHMRRRCFSSELIPKSELMHSATLKDETLKTVASALGLF